MKNQKIVRENYTVELEEPTLYVDNQSRHRSGHMSHAMAEFAPNTIIDFNSNCSALRINGHSTYGWIEYRISRDAGKTYSEVKELPYAKQAFLDGMFNISVEKAVGCSNGRIVAFCLRNSQGPHTCCEPWFTPYYVCSDDGGETWGEPKELSPYPGRMYDALYYDGAIYVLEFCNAAEDTFVGTREEDVYRIYISEDNGESFRELCVVPMNTHRRGYGSFLFDDQGRLHVYAYNEYAEREMDHVISEDRGKTWSEATISYVCKGIRNPQTALIDGVFILHGRAENGKGFVLYSSEDGHIWDEGVYLETEKTCCYYSNNILLKGENGDNFLLIQYSDTYAEARVNVCHMRLRICR